MPSTFDQETTFKITNRILSVETDRIEIMNKMLEALKKNLTIDQCKSELTKLQNTVDTIIKDINALLDEFRTEIETSHKAKKYTWFADYVYGQITGDERIPRGKQRLYKKFRDIYQYMQKIQSSIYSIDKGIQDLLSLPGQIKNSMLIQWLKNEIENNQIDILSTPVGTTKDSDTGIESDDGDSLKTLLLRRGSRSSVSSRSSSPRSPQDSFIFETGAFAVTEEGLQKDHDESEDQVPPPPPWKK